MSKTTTKKTSDVDRSALRPEYRFDYSKSRPNRFSGRAGAKPVVVLLAQDVAKVFKDGDSVNAALRAILQAVPRKRSSK